VLVDVDDGEHADARVLPSPSELRGLPVVGSGRRRHIAGTRPDHVHFD
jgi:hypothetical protein